MFDPGKKEYLKKLRTSIDWSERHMKPFRDKASEFDMNIRGQHWGSGRKTQAQNTIIVPYLFQAVDVLVRNLVPTRPACMITSAHPGLKAMALRFELAVNQVIHEIRLKDSVRRAVWADALGLGMLKGGITPTGTIEYEQMSIPVEGLFYDPVELDDVILDLAASSFNELTYIGNWYRIPLEDARNNPLFSRRQVDKIEKSARLHSHSEYGLERKTRKLIGQDSEDEADFEPYIELGDIHLPGSDMLITIPRIPNEDVGCLAKMTWDGPEYGHGPYHPLGLQPMDGSCFPMPFCATLLEQHLIANQIEHKEARRAERAKTVTAFEGKATQDAKALTNAEDGEVIKVNHFGSIQEITTGGPDQMNQLYAARMRELFNWSAGNIDSTAGLRSQSDTLGQDRLLSQAANARLASFQERTTEWLHGVMKSIAWYVWTDPIRERQIPYKIPGSDITTMVEFSPETRKGSFFEFDIEITPYNMGYSSPSEKMQSAMFLLQNVLMPMRPELQQNGSTLDVDAIVDLFARYQDMPEIREFLQSTMMSPEEAPGGTAVSPVPGTPRSASPGSGAPGPRSSYDDVIQQIGAASRSN